MAAAAPEAGAAAAAAAGGAGAGAEGAGGAGELPGYFLPTGMMGAIIAQARYNPDDGAVRAMIDHVKAGKDAMWRPHIFQASKYPTVYLTSDIHSDFRKLISVLKGIGLIETAIDPYNGDDIYNPDLITETKWIGGEHVMFVIIGDLVDGRRAWDGGRFVGSCNDPRGMFELLQYCFLYNLRIRARQVNSEVICTIGNHEMNSILNFLLPASEIDPRYKDGIYNDNVTDEAKLYFGNDANRRANALKIFLEASPYFMIGLQNGENKEVACIHGGLHSTINYRSIDLTKGFEKFQDAIDTRQKDLLEGVIYIFDRPLTHAHHSKLHPLWTRDYTESQGGYCDKIKETPYSLIVVGHCTTDSTKRTGQLITDKKDLYSGCHHGAREGRGCVFIDCENPERGGPQLAFVDTAMSQSQRQPAIWNERTYVQLPIDRVNNNRAVEVLRLRHTDAAAAAAPAAEAMGGAGGAAQPASRFYNIVERVNSETKLATQLYPYPPPPPAALPESAPPATELGVPNMKGGGAKSRKRRQTRRRRTKTKRQHRRAYRRI
jgi:hypothetical protein